MITSAMLPPQCVRSFCRPFGLLMWPIFPSLPIFPIFPPIFPLELPTLESEQTQFYAPSSSDIRYGCVGATGDSWAPGQETTTTDASETIKTNCKRQKEHVNMWLTIILAGVVVLTCDEDIILRITSRSSAVRDDKSTRTRGRPCPGLLNLYRFVVSSLSI